MTEKTIIKEGDCSRYSFYRHKTFLEENVVNDEKGNSIIGDLDDFWRFVNKYESIIQNTRQSIHSLGENNINSLEPFCKRKLIALEFGKPSRYFEGKHATYGNEHFPDIKQFRELILIYLDFKQKEKFNKLRKLRICQKSLPVYHYKDEIRTSLEDSRVLLVAGDTGCGKSTQIPQYLHEFGYRSVACTQPRRLACVSLSKRVAHEMLDDYGCKVGFQIRFEKNKTSYTNILFITEGLLLRQLTADWNSYQYDVLVLDEIHERNLFGDFLLGVTKCLLLAKPTLKLILMSATINTELFYAHFQGFGVKIIQVPGRLFPIKTVYIPQATTTPDCYKRRHNRKVRLDPALYVQNLSLIDQNYPLTERGDVLIFVSGVTEITNLCEAIKDYAEHNPHWIILPLHSGLALTQQEKVFDYAPDGWRKCIVSTNIAETSLTVDGIRFVIDSGKVKEMSYDSSCKGLRLKEFWISKSSAEQRKGRAGRTGPGSCFRLFSQKQYEEFEAYPTPEIFRVPLDTVLLQMIAMGLPNVRDFPYIERPSNENIEQTIFALKQHNALSFDEKITPLGRALSSLPVEISIAKLLLMGSVFPDVEKIITLAAVMSVQNPLTSRAFTNYKCEQERSLFESDQGDIFTLLRIYKEWLLTKLNRENSHKWCLKLGIEEQRLYEIVKLRNQFERILKSYKITTEDASNVHLSKFERTYRHGEVRLLNAIKRKQKYGEPRRRKVLKKGEPENESEDLDNNEDIRDVEFRLNHDSTKIEALLSSSNVEKSEDLLFLKLTLLSGFYPNIAIADDFNYCKNAAEQFFHTSLKPFVSIHPNSYFVKNYDVLRLSNSDILRKPDYYTLRPELSSAHQVIGFQYLLETDKPYLINCVRLPAAQALLLFSYSIDTNVFLSRLVCDSWICFDFPIPDTGCEILCQAIKIRYLWSKLVSQRLVDMLDSLENAVTRAHTTINLKVPSKQQEELWQMIKKFMSRNISFTMKRLLPADLKSLYTRDTFKYDKLSINPFQVDYPISHNKEKGGINVTENVVYGCVNETDWTITMETAKKEQSIKICKYCQFRDNADTFTRVIHKIRCTPKSSNNDDTHPAQHKQQDTSNKSKPFYCKSCEKMLNLTVIDILKHKESCK